VTYPNLKPCPKCSGEMLLWGYEGWNGSISSWRAECDACDYIGSCEGRKLDAIREHNRRALPTSAASQSAEGVPARSATDENHPPEKDRE
jgi:hypothetical protein